MSEFHDPELERLLGTSGGPFPDVNVAYGSVQGRVRRAQRRRALAASGATFSVLLAVGALTIGRSSGSESVQPGDGGVSTAADDTRLHPDPTSTTIAVTTTAASTTSAVTTTTPATTVSDSTVVPDPAGGQGDVGGGPANTVRDTTAPKTTAPKTTLPRTTVPKTTVPVLVPVPVDEPTTDAPTQSSEQPRDPDPLPVTATFNGVGGSIVVRMDGDTLVLVSYEAADGYFADVRRQSGSHVEVRFDSVDHRTEVRVDLDHGTMVQHIDESDT
jgi:hypothetical protein